MGSILYIEVPERKNKAMQLVSMHSAIAIIGQPLFEATPEGEVLLCVVENSMFDAIAICCNYDDYTRLLPTPDDLRPRTWLYLDRATVIKLQPLAEDLPDD